MLLGRRFLAVVPARGGSESIPRKNLRTLAGKPLLVYTLEQIGKLPEIDHAVVSTDDPEIASVAKENGVRAVVRPRELATDSAPTEWALLHALDTLEAEGEPQFDYVVTLEPTSPLRTPETTRRCMRTIVEHGGASLMTVVETRANYGRLEGNFFRPLSPDASRRRQERTPLYCESSTVYVARVEYLYRSGTLVSPDWLAVVVAPEEAIDINVEADFRIAEAMIGGDWLC